MTKRSQVLPALVLAFGCASSCALAFGCASAPRAEPSPSTRDPSRPSPLTGEASAQEDAQPKASAREDARALPAHATFADLVDAARTLDERGHPHGARGCLLAGERPFRLEADLMAGARPLPPALERLAPELEKAAGPVPLLTAWGSAAGGELALVLVAFTRTTPAALSGHPLALFLTQRGVFVRGAPMQVRAHPDALSIESAAALVSDLPASQSHGVYVTAEAAVPLTELRALLRALPERFETALAVALPPGTRLPDPAPDSPASSWRCPDGLPAPADDEAEGELSVQTLQHVLLPLRDSAQGCALMAAGRALLGGKLTLALRIAESGEPESVCVRTSDIDEPLLERCLVESARSLRFPAPDPRGFVDVHLPLHIALDGPERQRSLCD